MPDFPANPSSGEIFEVASGVYRWDGTKWTLLEQPEEIGVPWLVANPVGSNGVKAIPPMFDANAYLSPPLMMEQIWNEINAGGGGGGVSSFNTRTGAVTLTTADVTGAGGAPLASPTFTGSPAAPTPAPGDSSTSLATTAFVGTAITSAAVPAPSSTVPVMDGTGTVGTGASYARADHVHPSDTSRLSDAPSDNTWYGRTNATWSQVVPLNGYPNNNNKIGSGAGASLTTGPNNIMIGTSAGSALTTGQHNISIGSSAGLLNSSTNFNINIGGFAGEYFTTGPNTNIGYIAGQGVSGSTTGVNNTNLGYSTGSVITTGSQNTHAGHLAGGGITSGSANVMVGYLAGFKITTTNSNVIVGSSTFTNATTAANNVAVGAGAGAAIVTGSTNILIGFGANAPSDTSNYINIGGLITGQMNTGPIAVSKAVNFTGSIGVNGTTAPAKPTVSGAKGSNAALASLIAALVSYGLITDTTTA